MVVVWNMLLRLPNSSLWNGPVPVAAKSNLPDFWLADSEGYNLSFPEGRFPPRYISQRYAIPCACLWRWARGFQVGVG